MDIERAGRNKRHLPDAAFFGGIGRRRRDHGPRLQIEDHEALEADMKVERFFEFMRRIRDMKGSWATARSGTTTNDDVARASPPWTPRLCWEDFAPAATAAAVAASAAQQVNSRRHRSPKYYHAEAAPATINEEGEDQGDEETIVSDGYRNGGSAVTLDQPRVEGAVLARNGDRGIRNNGYGMTNAAADDDATRGTRVTLDQPRVEGDVLLDCLSGGVLDSAAACPRGGEGRESTNAAACSLELKLALR